MLKIWNARRREYTFPSSPFVHWLIVALLASITGMPMLAIVAFQPTSIRVTVELDFPEQPVSSALWACARQTDVDLLIMTEVFTTVRNSVDPQ